MIEVIRRIDELPGTDKPTELLCNIGCSNGSCKTII